ncbi:zinc ribbon domain-containing protein [Armatimonas sp.]|uniref:FmdB family zinc ribbon protein n=1 Tax=Armatimonas sp. TaxID=1872638 RepID=UPI00286C759E|nr:zinc ribbon domain-containing protein [Armatimonas sp.]
MPTYTYRCDEPCETCSGTQEIFQRMSDAPLTQCEECQKPMRRIVSLPLRAVVNSGNLSDSNIEAKGFTKYVRAGKGRYEKVAGSSEAPSTLDGNNTSDGF